MTNTERGLLDDIIEHPEDDVPRLILSDWLEEHGEEEHAEFIRVQVELDRDGLRDAECNKDAFHSKKCRGDKRDKCERAIYLKHREKGLLDAYLFDKIAPVVNGNARYTFRRGFVEEIHAPLAVLREHLPRLVQEHPILSVRATDREPRIIFSRANDFLWLPGISQTHLHEIPFEVAQRLGRKATFVSGLMVYSYPTVEAAHDDLSVALLKLSKHYSLERNRHDQTRMG